ncbi:uncharacterized protein LMH87_007626 [Akanthomyces muscarius]|uniref:RING-type domain-containing protein n=1 Tax=Akanthomyces muscarius TaxID=2231603 RepID=A0A9W8QK46_AKAMU|nr:uncharacterized protein LMH87_007626 [Akanthomyces muscarius]KAJ4161595.1 hypothetical protein LMH87_007626 [Akanthomyces muscarius]
MHQDSLGAIIFFSGYLLQRLFNSLFHTAFVTKRENMPTVQVDGPAADNLTTIGPTGDNRKVEEVRKSFVDQRIKIASHACPICWDNAQGLTATSCGHLFCAKCIHEWFGNASPTASAPRTSFTIGLAFSQS